MAQYGVVHTTNIRNMKLYDFQSTVDVENGTLIAKGPLVSGERNIYTAITATDTDKLYLTANPAWDYDECRTVNQNEDAFVNEAGRVFRCYGLEPNDRFRITDYSLNGTAEVGSYVDHAYNISSTKPTSAFIGRIVAVDSIGFVYNMGSVGNVDNSAKMVLIEVVQNG